MRESGWERINESSVACNKRARSPTKNKYLISRLIWFNINREPILTQLAKKSLWRYFRRAICCVLERPNQGNEKISAELFFFSVKQDNKLIKPRNSKWLDEKCNLTARSELKKRESSYVNWLDFQYPTIMFGHSKVDQSRTLHWFCLSVVASRFVAALSPIREKEVKPWWERWWSLCGRFVCWPFWAWNCRPTGNTIDVSKFVKN